MVLINKSLTLKYQNFFTFDLQLFIEFSIPNVLEELIKAATLQFE